MRLRCVPGCVVLKRCGRPAAEGGIVLFVDSGMTERDLERARESHWRRNQRFSPRGGLGLCVPYHHFEFNVSLKFCFRLYYTVFCGKMQDGNGEKA